MRARQPRKHMSHMGSTKTVTIDPRVAKMVLDVKQKKISPAALKVISESIARSKAAKIRNYWLIGGGVALVAVVSGVLIHKSRSKNKG